MAYKEGATNVGTVTQYATLIGGAGGAIGSVAAVASGEVFASNGTSSNPSFQNLTASAGSSVTFTGLSLGVTDGGDNVLIGASAGNGTLSGTANSGLGFASLNALTNGSNNMGIGYASLDHVNSGSNNVGIGANSANAITSGSYNVAIGSSAGSSYATSDSSNIAIGYGVNGVGGQSNVLTIGNGTGTGNGNINVAIICGITGKTSASGAETFTNSSNVLGTSTSSIRYKFNVENMGDTSERILKLRPVKFNYKPSLHVSEEESQIAQYGLIAEEVFPIIPEMVLYNSEGEIDTLKYRYLAPLLLNELQKALKRIESLEKAISRLSS